MGSGDVLVRGSEYVARANRLRRLMVGLPDPSVVMAGIKEIVDERIAELNKRFDDRRSDGGSSGPKPE